jgi:hypothetical protein
LAAFYISGNAYRIGIVANQVIASAFCTTGQLLRRTIQCGAPNYTRQAGLNGQYAYGFLLYRYISSLKVMGFGNKATDLQVF